VELLTRRGDNPEFLMQFADERIARGFAGFDLAAGEFPLEGAECRPFALTREHTTITTQYAHRNFFHLRRYENGNLSQISAGSVKCDDNTLSGVRPDHSHNACPLLGSLHRLRDLKSANIIDILM
jgi:hypothetical protein